MKTLLLRLLSCVVLLAASRAVGEVKLPWNEPKPHTGKVAPAPPPADKPVPAPPPTDEGGPPARIDAPDGKSAVRMLQKAMPGNDGITDFFTLEVLQGNKVVARVATEGYLISAHWNADGSMVAVNNRRGNSGDYVWVFSLPGGAVLKQADDGAGEAWLAAAAKALKANGQNGEIYKSWLNATGWSAAGELEVAARLRLRGGAGFDFSAPAAFMNGKWKMSGGKIKVVPKE